MSRREILKLGAGALIAAFVSPFISAQSAKGTASVGDGLAASQVDGNISYNAGWVVPLEDKAALLALEARKTKERDDLAKQKASTNSESASAAKDNSKSIGGRLQEIMGKIKRFF